MKHRALLVAALLAATTSAFAQNQMLDTLKGQLGKPNATSGTGLGGEAASGGAAAGLASSLGLSMPSIGTSTMGNAAGVLEYCVKNNYLSADAAGGVKDKLLGAVTGQKPQETGYASGVQGMLQGGDGKSLSLDSVNSQLKTKACDYVLSNAKSLI